MVLPNVKTSHAKRSFPQKSVILSTRFADGHFARAGRHIMKKHWFDNSPRNVFCEFTTPAQSKSTSKTRFGAARHFVIQCNIQNIHGTVATAQFWPPDTKKTIGFHSFFGGENNASQLQANSRPTPPLAWACRKIDVFVKNHRFVYTGASFLMYDFWWVSKGRD